MTLRANFARRMQKDMSKIEKGERSFKAGDSSFSLLKVRLTASENETDCKFLEQLTIAKMLSSRY